MNWIAEICKALIFKGGNMGAEDRIAELEEQDKRNPKKDDWKPECGVISEELESGEMSHGS